MKKISIHNLYLNLLQELHSCERQNIEVLPHLAEAASDESLRKIFNKHLEESREHLLRLDHILSCLYGGSGWKVCKVTLALVKAGEDLIIAEADKKVRDAGLICVAQRLAHIQIAMYGCLRAYASLIHRATDVRLLDLTLREEEEAERSLINFVTEPTHLHFKHHHAMAGERQRAMAM